MDGGLNLRPPIEHLVIAESQDAISERAEHRVSPTIGLELSGIRVVGEPIDFDNQPISEHEIDSTYPCDDRLPPKVERSAEPLPDEGLRARLADAVDSRQCRPERAGRNGSELLPAA